ncbi:MAG: hypothetical protein B7Z72_04495, partial [Gemmatimonadetes bacterium 21-71-4]
IYDVRKGTTEPGPPGLMFPGAWSPGSAEIAYLGQPPEPTASPLWVYDVRTRANAQLTGEPIYAFFPAWSPNGRRIAFAGVTGGKDYGPCL